MACYRCVVCETEFKLGVWNQDLGAYVDPDEIKSCPFCTASWCEAEELGTGDDVKSGG